MLETILLLSAAIVAAVEFCKGILIQMGWFNTQSETNQSLILQILAFAIGVLAAFSWDANLFVGLTQFTSMPNVIGIFFTGLIAATGSAGIHVIYAVLGNRGNVVAEVPTTIRAHSDTGASRKSYAPFL